MGAHGDGDDDLSAFDAVFDRHFDDIHRFVARRLGRDVADDLAATVFVEAYAGRASYDADAGPVRPWLFGIATNLMRRHHRTEERRLRAYARHGVDPVASDPGALERVDSAGDGPELARALAKLARRDRDVLLLYAWADMTYGEIAQALGVPIGTVRSRLARARTGMQARLAARGAATRATGPLLFEGELDG
jgi:RNA polymerase sigma-70 factor (ECF subfamily)